MKQKRFTEAQIAFSLRQADSGTPVGEIVRKIVDRHAIMTHFGLTGVAISAYLCIIMQF